MRRGLETTERSEGRRKGTQSQPVSRASSPAATRLYRTSVGPVTSKENINVQNNPVRKDMFVKTEMKGESLSEVIRSKSSPSYLTKENKEHLNSATAMKEKLKNQMKTNKVNESQMILRNNASGNNEKSAVKEWVENQNKYFDKGMTCQY